MDKKIKKFIDEHKITDDELLTALQALRAESPPADDEESEEEDNAEEPPAPQEKAKPQTPPTRVSFADLRKAIKEEITEALKPPPKPGAVKPEPKTTPLPPTKPKPLGKLGEFELIM